MVPTTRDEAAATALRAAAWLASDRERLDHFLAASGIGAGDLQAGLAEPHVQAAILDFVLMDDAWILAFAASAGIAPEHVAAARTMLPGGQAPNWT